MKYLLLFILILPVTMSGQQIPVDSIIGQEAVNKTLAFLSADSLRGRLTGSVGADKAAAYIETAFKDAGLIGAADNNSFFDSFPIGNKKDKRSGKNVMAAIPGQVTNDTIVIFSAHYDHVGEKDDMDTHQPYGAKDDIFNGANDNATGVTALLELAKYYQSKKNNRYQLIFIAFAGEEMGLLGSTYLVKKINPKIVKAVINLEMLGRPAHNNCFIVSFRNTAIRNLLNDQLQQYQPGSKKFFQTDPYPDENLAYRSDHYPFTHDIKNAFTIMATSPLDEYYHSADDEYDTIDKAFLLKAIRQIALACEVFFK